MIRISIVSSSEQKSAVESLRVGKYQYPASGAAVAVETTFDEYDLLADDGYDSVGVIRVRERRSDRVLELAQPALQEGLSYEQNYNARTGLLRFALHRASRSGLERVVGAGLPYEASSKTLRDVEDLFGTFADAPTVGTLADQDQFALSTKSAVDEYILLSYAEVYTFDSGTGEVVRGELEEQSPFKGFGPYRKRVIYGPGERVPAGSYIARCPCEIVRSYYEDPLDYPTYAKPAVASIGLGALNSYVLAHIICSLEDVGYFDYLTQSKTNSLSFTGTCEALKVRCELFRHMLRYLEIAGLVRFNAHHADSYTYDRPAIERLRREMGYLVFMVRGYTPVLSEMSALVRGEKRYYHDIRRNDEGVQRFFQSYEIDVQPELDRILDGLSYKHVAHIGCGAATRLIALCQKYPHLKATGIEIEEAACATARANVEKAGLSDRITIVHRDIYKYVQEPHQDIDLVLLVAGMFHDFHNRPQGATALLQALRNCISPDAYLVVEDQNLSGGTEPAFPLSVAEGFEFVHTLVGAKLFTREQYTDLFTGAGWTVELVRGNQLACDWIYVLRGC